MIKLIDYIIFSTKVVANNEFFNAVLKILLDIPSIKMSFDKID